MTDPIDQRIEAAAARAWPARIVQPVGPWLARASDGFTQRANSVAVLGSRPPELETVIDDCEQFYARWELPSRFQIADTDRTAPVRQAVEQRGYRPGPAVIVMTRDLQPAVADPDDEVALSPGPSPEWLDLWWSVDGRSPAHRNAAVDLLERVPEPRAFALASHGRVPAGVGLGVAAGPLAGFFCAATRPDHRGEGVGLRVASRLSAWAEASEATTAYVQVLASNEASRRLSTRHGFVPIYTYRYWQRP